jgi:hypothetical protein
MSPFTAIWGTLLILSSVLGVVLAVFITVWTLNVMKTMLSNPDWDDKNKIAKFILIVLFGPLTFASFLAMIWLDRYPPPTSTTVMYSIAIVTFGYILFIGKRKEGKPRDWKAWSVMLVFVSSVFLLFSLACVARGATLKLQNRLAFHGVAAVLGYEFENADYGDNADQGESFIEGTVHLAWNCGDFVCLNTSTFYCSNMGTTDMLGDSEVLADTTYQTKYHINNGYSPCGDDLQEIGEYYVDANLKESGNPYVYVHGMCTSSNECPVRIDSLPFSMQPSLYSDEELHDYIQANYWKRADNAGDIFEIKAFRLLMVALVCLAMARKTYYYLANPTLANTEDKAVDLLPKHEGESEHAAQESTVKQEGVSA